MIALNRTNMHGKPFKLVEVFGKPATAIRAEGEQIIVQHDIRLIAERWHLWVMGQKLEDAFYFLTVEERAFIQKGVD